MEEVSCRGKTCLCGHFGQAKVLFCYVNLQDNFCWGGQSQSKFFYLGALAPVPPSRHMPAMQWIENVSLTAILMI